MGRSIDQIEYSRTDFTEFKHMINNQLDQLKCVLAQPDFGSDPLMLGVELEMYLVDDEGKVSCSNQLLINELQDPQYQVELNQYNLELNLSEVPQKGRPFSLLAKELHAKGNHLAKLALAHNIHIIAIGILPTLRLEHLNKDFMTDFPRYHSLSDQIYRQRGEDIKININGDEPVNVSFDHICSEGANTSFQVHMMVKKDKFTNTFNAAQFSLPLVTALAGNSSIFLGQKLWDETRIALFKQSTDIRVDENQKLQQPTRVNFGFGWLRQDPWELFAEAVTLYSPLLPCVTKINSASNLPALDELNLHMGTIWPWHRPVYSHHNHGHVRIEFRALPAGPTSEDMIANAAFAIGLAAGYADNIDQYLPLLPFCYAEYNFYRAAQFGLDAKILWPISSSYQLKEIAIIDVITASLPIAKRGLHSLAIDDAEIDYYLGIIEQRLAMRVTGAIWQKLTLAHLEQNTDKDSACQALVELYLENVRSGKPVAQWPRIWSAVPRRNRDDH